MKDNVSYKIIADFVDAVSRELISGRATEHSYRPAIKALLNSLDSSIEAINEPKQSEHGAPDFIIIGKKNNDIKLGYGEAKDINVGLDKIEKSEQLDRYKGYANLFLTNNLDWRFFRNGEKIYEIKIGELAKDQKSIAKLYTEKYTELANELANFLSQTPESLTNGKRLAEIMGGKARRIRDNIEHIFNDGKDAEILNIYDMMKQLLVSDLSVQQFADMYAQTLVYGLFVARYNDNTAENFTRAEARDLVPATNPFLREFFDHITGSNFNRSLSYIVDELCEIFAVSDIKGIVHKHLKITSDDEKDIKDPIIHFYEDFLASYDAKLRKQMGAYYTPIPVVRYIIRQVDRILKENFNIADGLASNEKIKYTQKTDPYQIGKGKDAKTYYESTLDLPKVQILDPAVGTATFLNETIKYIYNKRFENQAGLWPSYVNDNILPRLNGFELMMTPYTIAHLKLGMTLSELGAKKLNDRLRIFLTNTLSEGGDFELPLFAFGLMKVVAKEAELAAEVKNERPMMVVMGNPPYSVSSSNKGTYIQDLIKIYKKDLGERKINLDDDYIKFIRFSENMVEKNGKGILAMITNNSYIDGITHRQMRKHLLETFDQIYILDLHGNAKKKEVAPDGSPDQNVFDIMQGVSIILAVKTSESKALGKVYHAELYGKRAEKFNALNNDAPKFKLINYTAPNYFFVPKDNSLILEYEEGVSINDLFTINTSGIESQRDSFVIADTADKVKKHIEDLLNLPEQELRTKYNLGVDGRNWTVKTAKSDVGIFDSGKLKQINYRPFDIRFTYYTGTTNGISAWPRFRSGMSNMLLGNIGIIFKRGFSETKAAQIGISDNIIDRRFWSRPGMQGAEVIAPLYVYHEDGTRDPNFELSELAKLTVNIGEQSPEDILDYIYAVLHSPSYRTKYAEFLKIDFPRVPIPSAKDFARLVPLGRELRELHLMKSSVKITTSFPELGDNGVEKIVRIDDKVYINGDQYFGGVSDIAWNFFIGGYQPAQKWLKDRKGRELKADDVIHYQKIIAILDETDRLMKEIK